MISFVCCLGPQRHPRNSKRQPEHKMIFCFNFSAGRLLTSYHPRPYCFLSFPLLTSSLLPFGLPLSLPHETSRWFSEGAGRTSGLFAGRVSGSQHQISRFLGYVKRADPFPVVQRHKRIRQEWYYPGKDVSWEFKDKWKWMWECCLTFSPIISIEETRF